MQTYMTQDCKKLKSLDWSCLLLFLLMIRVEGGQEQEKEKGETDGKERKKKTRKKKREKGSRGKTTGVGTVRGMIGRTYVENTIMDLTFFRLVDVQQLELKLEREGERVACT